MKQLAKNLTKFFAATLLAATSAATAWAQDDATFTITPSPDGGPYTPEDFQEIRIHCENYVLSALPKTPQAATPVSLGNGVQVRAFRYARTEDNGHTAVFVRNDSYTKGTVDQEYWDTDTYGISLTTQMFYVGTTPNKYTVFNGYQIVANEKAKGWSVYPDSDGAAIEKIDKVSIKFPCKVKVNDATKNITIKRDGETVWTTGANNPTANTVKTTGKGANQVTYNVSPALTAPGVYEVIYDEDAFIQLEAAKHTSDRIAFSFVIPEVVEHTVSPAPAAGKRENNELVLTSNGVIGEFGQFTITYPEGSVVELTDKCAAAIEGALFRNNVVQDTQVFTDAPSVNNLVPCTGLEIKAEGNVVTVKFAQNSKRATGPNKFWCQEIPVGVWNITKDGVTTPNTHEYIYWQIPEITGVTLTPVEEGNFGTMRYVGYNNIYALNAGTEESPVAPVLKKGTRVVATYTSTVPTAQPYTELTFTSTDDLSAVKGNCVFEIPAGYLGLDVKYPTMPAYWTNPLPVRIPVALPGVPEIQHNVTPAPDDDTLGELSLIKVSFPEATVVELREDATPTLTMPDGTVLNGTVLTLPDEATAFNCYFELGQWVNGNYTFALPADAVTVDGDPFSGLSHVYTLSNINTGIESVSVSSRTYTVYRADGVLLMKDAPASALKSLPKGFYIVNNKKIVVR